MKVGIDQKNNPAPVWYRRFRDGMVNFMLPGAATLITGWGLSDKLTNRWLLALTFLPMVLNGIAVWLGDDVKKTVRTWLILIGLATLAYGCRTPAQIATDNARKQAVKDSVAREQRMQQLQQVRTALPCHPVKIVQGITRYLPGDSIPCSDNGKCPPLQERTDTVYYEDMAALAAVRDSLAQTLYVQCLKDAHILSLQQSYDKQVKRADDATDTMKYWRGRFWWLVGILCAVGVAWAALSGRISLILKPFLWLLSKLR